MSFRTWHLLFLFSLIFSLSACVNTTSLTLEHSNPNPSSNTFQSTSPHPNPILSPPTSIQRIYSTDVLLFNGSGTWAAEVTSLENILSSHGATYQEVTSLQLDAMALDEIAKFGLLIFPGGSGGTQAGSLSADTHARLRAAVQERGVSYLGFCAGAFIAIAPTPAAPGQDVSYGLGVVNGPVLNYYYLENQGTDIAMTLETFADGSKRDLVWYGGPVTPNITGGIIAKYPDGNPAITQIWSGKGFVIVSGPHPAAPQSVRDTFGLKDSDGIDFDLAWKLIEAALHQQPLPAF